MDVSIGWFNFAALGLAMLVMASLPSISVFAVIMRASQFGFWQGAITALGIVVADILFVLVALFGLVWLVENVAWLFHLIAYLGAFYLLWLATRLWHSQSETSVQSQAANASSLASFSLGLSLTFADQKAVLFYLGFFPAFLNLSQLTHWDAGLVVLLALLAVGLPKVVYAYLAAHGFALLTTNKQTLIQKTISVFLTLVGLFLMVKTTTILFE